MSVKTIKIANVDDVEAIAELLRSSGFEINIDTPKITKGEMILAEIREVAASGTFVTRKEIALRTNATVSRVSEILTEYADDADVLEYHKIDIETKALRKKTVKQEKLMAQLIKVQEELSKIEN